MGKMMIDAQRLPVPGSYTADIPPVSQEQINAFGALVGTYGRIHTDPEWAATTPLKGVIVQGMLILAPLHEALRRMFNDRWTSTGEVECKIVNSARPNENNRLSIQLLESAADAARGSFRIEKADGTAVIVGDFRIGAGS